MKRSLLVLAFGLFMTASLPAVEPKSPQKNTFTTFLKDNWARITTAAVQVAGTAVGVGAYYQMAASEWQANSWLTTFLCTQLREQVQRSEDTYVIPTMTQLLQSVQCRLLHKIDYDKAFISTKNQVDQNMALILKKYAQLSHEYIKEEFSRIAIRQHSADWDTSVWQNPLNNAKRYRKIMIGSIAAVAAATLFYHVYELVKKYRDKKKEESFDNANSFIYSDTK